MLREEFRWLRNMRHTFCVSQSQLGLTSSKCSNHQKERCVDDECIQLSPIGKGVGALNVANGDWSQANEDKQEFPIPVDLMRLALKAESVWRELGKVLGFSESALDRFQSQGKSNRSSLFLMLMSRRGCTYPELGMALMDSTVQRGDLASEYCTKEEYVRKSYTVGPEGRSFCYHEVKVDVPRGALDKEITLSMSVLKTSPRSEKKHEVSSIIRFHCEPKDTTFKAPVKVYLPFYGSATKSEDATSQSKMRLMCSREGNTWKEVEEDKWRRGEAGLHFESTEFSAYVVFARYFGMSFQFACYLFGKKSNETLEIYLHLCPNAETQKAALLEMYKAFPLRELGRSAQILDVYWDEDLRIRTVVDDDSKANVKPKKEEFKANYSLLNNPWKHFKVFGALDDVSQTTELKFEISTGNNPGVELILDLYHATEDIRMSKQLKDLTKEKEDLTKKLTDITKAYHDLGKKNCELRMKLKTKRITNLGEGNEAQPTTCKMDKEEQAGSSWGTDYRAEQTSEDISDPVIDDVLLMDLSKKILLKWEKVATYLNFDSYDVDELKDDMPDSSKQERAHEMLKRWKRNNGNKNGATKNVLAAALRRANFSEAANEVLSFKPKKQ